MGPGWGRGGGPWSGLYEVSLLGILSLSVQVVGFKPLILGLRVDCSTTVLPGNK
jgi:hypothetical protein